MELHRKKHKVVFAPFEVSDHLVYDIIILRTDREDFDETVHINQSYCVGIPSVRLKYLYNQYFTSSVQPQYEKVNGRQATYQQVHAAQLLGRSYCSIFLRLLPTHRAPLNILTKT